MLSLSEKVFVFLVDVTAFGRILMFIYRSRLTLVISVATSLVQEVVRNVETKSPWSQDSYI